MRPLTFNALRILSVHESPLVRAVSSLLPNQASHWSRVVPLLPFSGCAWVVPLRSHADTHVRHPPPTHTIHAQPPASNRHAWPCLTPSSCYTGANDPLDVHVHVHAPGHMDAAGTWAARSFTDGGVCLGGVHQGGSEQLHMHARPSPSPSPLLPQCHAHAAFPHALPRTWSMRGACVALAHAKASVMGLVKRVLLRLGTEGRACGSACSQAALPPYFHRPARPLLTHTLGEWPTFTGTA